MALSRMKKLIFIIIIILLLVTIYRTIFAIKDTYGSIKKAETLKVELETKSQKNAFLKERLQYVQTDTFINEQARNQLGLVQKDEYVILAPPPEEKEFNEKILDDTPNWRKWFEMLF